MNEDQNFDDRFTPPNKRIRRTNYSSGVNYDDDSMSQYFSIEEENPESRSSFSRNSSNDSMYRSSDTSTRRQFAGLRNLGSTCYMNCIIQVMRFSPGFSLSIHRLAKQIDHLKSLSAEMVKEIDGNNETQFVKHLHELLIDMSDREKSDRRPIYSPRKFVNTVWNSLSFWSDSSQQDAHEFLQYTIHFINECDVHLKKLHQQYKLSQWEKKDLKIQYETTPSLAHHHQQQSYKCKSVASLSSLLESQQEQQKENSNPHNTFKKLSHHNSTNILRTPTKGGASTTCQTQMQIQQTIAIDNKYESLKLKSIESDLVFKPTVKIAQSATAKTPPRASSSASKKNKPNKIDEAINKFNIKPCFVVLERLVTKSPDVISTSVITAQNKCTNVNSKPENQNEEAAQNIRTLRSKSKTFPLNVQSFTNELLDEIVTIGQSTTTTTTTKADVSTSGTVVTTTARQRSQRSTKTSTRSMKFRTSSFNHNHQFTQSPAELLRKYSSIKGYVCEMDKLFKGASTTLTQCLACENLRRSPEAFYDRSLPINTNLNESMDLDWIIKSLSNESYLDDDSKYMCDVCKCKQEAKIYTQYPEMPSLLILHLLSYGITSSVDGNLNTQKLNSRSRLVTSFDCVCIECTNKSNFIKTKHVFKLYAVVMHSGASLNSGHYTAFINFQIINENMNDTSQIDGSNVNPSNCSCTSNCTHDDFQSSPKPEWLHFDDTKVKSLTSNEFHRKIIDSNYDSPYILFYFKYKMSL